MNNLTELREQLQEDMLTYFNESHERLTEDAGEINLDEVCQIIVDRVTELQDKWDIKNEDDAMKNATSFVNELINKTIEG
jgi:hypothetical protein